MKLKINLLLLSSVAAFSLMSAQETQNKIPAESWIKANAKTLNILPQSKMELNKVRKGNAGEVLRYQQSLNGVPVYQSEVVLKYNKQNQLSFTETSSVKKIENIDTNPSITSEQALAKGLQAAKLSGNLTEQDSKLYVYLTDDAQTKLVYRVVQKSFDDRGTWETMVDAKTGDVISVKDINIYHHKGDHGDDPKPKPKSAETKKVGGTGYIFDPDPLSATGSTYGGQYVDGNDATNASLDAARRLANIPELEFANGVYKLKGQYAEIRELESPATGLFTQSTPDFLFNRFDQGFEAVNAYWHIDNNLRYINDILGIECISLYNNGVVLYDPHGVGGDDNSYYTGGKLVFGEGCIDDAEDADVIIHELGHGVHDWISNGNLSQTQGLSEGSGDYWAQSYSRSLNQWASTTPQYNWVFSWDGHNTCWPGRTTAYTGNYPPTGAIHTAGQLWATVLMKIWDRIGKEKTDRIFLEGLSMTTSSSNQKVAATAARQSAIDMNGQFGFTCADVAIISEEFNARNFALPAYTCTDLAVADVKKNSIKLFPNPANDKINVAFSDSKNQTIEVYGLDGKKIIEAAVSKEQNSVDVSKLMKGIYILKVKGTDISEKFIKN